MAGTIKAVAQAAGVSKTTVSFVMNNTHPQVDRIPEETRERIRACAAELGYTHNPIAASLRTGKRVWIGIMTEVLPSDTKFWETAPFFEVSLLYGAQRGLAEHGYFTLLGLRKAESEVQDMDQLASAKVGGLIFRAADEQAVVKARELMLSGVHAVNVFPRRPNDLFPFTVDLDNPRAGRLAAEIGILSGARNPAYISLAISGRAMHDRVDGFIQAVREGLGVEPGVCELPQKPDGMVIGRPAYSALADFVNRNRPDAIVALDGGSSHILNSALDGIPAEIPRDLAVIGLDSFFCRNSKYQSMSSIGVSWVRAGEIAAKIIVDQVETGTTSDLPRRLPPVFLAGDTTPPGLTHELAIERLENLVSSDP